MSAEAGLAVALVLPVVAAAGEAVVVLASIEALAWPFTVALPSAAVASSILIVEAWPCILCRDCYRVELGTWGSILLALWRQCCLVVDDLQREELAHFLDPRTSEEGQRRLVHGSA